MAGKEHRRQPRFTVEGVHGKMTFASKVDVLNMSLSGVALKVDRRLNIGAEYALKLDLPDRSLSVKGVVVWSALDEMKKNSRGEMVPVYSAGMRFTDVLTPRVTELLTFIDTNKGLPDKRLGGIRFRIEATGKALLDVPHLYQVKIISMSGMLIEAEQPLELERCCPMEVSLDSGNPILFEGRVAYVAEAGDSQQSLWHMGIEFGGISAADRRRLDAFIRGLEPA